jgi:methylmalonyl-CoA/ethylmalonyl-CoA epimerase
MFTGIHHVAIAVRNLEPALDFYRDTLGLPLGTQAHVPDQGVMAALFPLANGEIELLEPTNPAGGMAKFVEKRGEGLHHFCVETTDITGAIDGAKAAGLPLIDQAPRQGLAGTIGFLHPGASQGVLVEMAQPGEASAHAAPTGGGVRAHAIETLYVAVKDLEAARTTFQRNFAGAAEPSAHDARFGVTALRLQVGRSSLTLLDAGALQAQPESDRFLAGRPEGLMGICLRVADLQAAMAHLKGCGIATELRSGEMGAPIARIDSDRTHGVNLYLC